MNLEYLEYLDYTTTTFANGFAGRSPLIDGFMVQVCFTYILSTVGDVKRLALFDATLPDITPPLGTRARASKAQPTA
jgi:hypothetical protein